MRIFAFFLCVFIVQISNAQIYNNEFWTELSCAAKLNKKTDIDIVLESKFQQYGLVTKSVAGELSISRKISKPISLGVSYKLSEKNKFQGFFPSHTASLILGVKEKFGNIKISYRNKFEIAKDSYINEYEDLFPVFEDRNKLKIQYVFDDFIASPSISMESFHSCKTGMFYNLTELRYAFDLDFDLKNKINAGIGYMYKISYSEQSIENINVIFVSISKRL